MIKINLRNWNLGRNNQTFRPFLMFNRLFNEIGVQFVDGGSYDFQFIGMSDFLDKKISLSESIEKGVDFIGKLNGDVFLFDGSDSTSLMGAWEVVENTNTSILFKNQILPLDDYKTPTAFNKWFFGNGSDLDLHYNISEDDYNTKLKLTGWNLGYYNPNYLNFVESHKERDIDVCAIYQGYHKENSDHCVRNDVYYTKHRTKVWDILKNTNGISYVLDKQVYDMYIDTLLRSKCTLSPFGMGEICFRDFEIIQYGSVMIKPDMSMVKTIPNIYIPYETYIPCKLDWSDLEDKIQWVMDNPIECKQITENARNIFKREYTIEKLLLYWYNIIKNFKNIIGYEESMVRSL